MNSLTSSASGRVCFGRGGWLPALHARSPMRQPAPQPVRQQTHETAEPPRRQQGFTLIELLVIVAFISILATLFGMNWASSIRRNAIDTTLTQFTRTLSSGRTEAIQRSQPIRLAALTCANGGACDWQKGWRLETITPSAELSRVAELHGALNITLMQPPTGSQTECQALSTPEVMRRIEFRPTGRVWFFKTTDDATRLSLSSICLRFGVGSDFTDLLISRMGSTEVLK